MRKTHARLASALLCALLLFSVTGIVFADVVPTPMDGGTNFTYTGKSFPWVVGSNTYTCKIYKATPTYYRIYSNKYAGPLIYHAKNTGGVTLTQTLSVSLSSQTATSFSSSVGMTVDAYVVQGTINEGYGISSTIGTTFGIENAVSFQIPSSASTGYYRINALHNYLGFRINRMKNNTLNNLYYCGIPTGQPYLGVIFSTSSGGPFARWN